MRKLQVLLISFIILTLSISSMFAQNSLQKNSNIFFSSEYDSSYNKSIRTIQINESENRGLYTSYIKIKFYKNNIEDLSIIWENNNFGYDNKESKIEYSFDSEPFKTVDCDTFYILARVKDYKDFYAKMLNSKELTLRSGEDIIKFDLSGFKSLSDNVIK